MAKGLRGIAIASGLVTGAAGLIERRRKQEIEDEERQEKRERRKLSQRQADLQEQTHTLNAFLAGIKIMETGGVDAQTAEKITRLPAGALSQVQNKGNLSDFTSAVIQDAIERESPGTFRSIPTPEAGVEIPPRISPDLGKPRASEGQMLATLAGRGMAETNKLELLTERERLRGERADVAAKAGLLTQQTETEKHKTELAKIQIDFARAKLPWAASIEENRNALLAAHAALYTSEAGLKDEQKKYISEQFKLAVEALDTKQFSAVGKILFNEEVMKFWNSAGSNPARDAMMKSLGIAPSGQPSPPGQPPTPPGPAGPGAPGAGPPPPVTTPKGPAAVREQQQQIFPKRRLGTPPPASAPAPVTPGKGGAIPYESPNRFAKTTLPQQKFPNTLAAVNAIPDSTPQELAAARKMLLENPGAVEAAGVDPRWLQVALDTFTGEVESEVW